MLIVSTLPIVDKNDRLCIAHVVVSSEGVRVFDKKMPHTHNTHIYTRIDTPPFRILRYKICVVVYPLQRRLKVHIV